MEHVQWRKTPEGRKSFRWIGTPKSHFNSRKDTITDPGKRYWYGLLQRKRCIIIAYGFGEPADDELRDKNKPKHTHFFRFLDARPFDFAGICDTAINDEG